MRKLNEYGLTQAQECFLQNYLKTSNGYQSYLIAYPSAKNWKRNSVDVQVNKLLNNAKINQRIKEHNEQIESTLKESITLNKRKILNEIISTYEQTAQNGAAERTNAVNLLKLMAQISKLLDNTPNINVAVQNNTVVNEVSDFLNL